MKRIVAAVGLMTLFSGCATVNRSPVLAGLSGVTYAEQGNGAFALQEVSFKTSGSKAHRDRVGICLTDNLHVSGVRLSDASSSFYGPYSKNYYNVERSSSLPGEQVLQYIASDGKEAVARGQVAYRFDSSGGLVSVPIDYVVRFTLKYEQNQDHDAFLFHRIEAAQQHTGSLPNSGFGPLYDLEPLKPEKAYFEMEKLANLLSDCLRNN